MLKNRLFPYIEKYVNDYLYGFTKDQLDLGVSKGKIKLENLNPRPDKINKKLDEKNIPFWLKAGSISSIFYGINLMNFIGEKPLDVQIENVNIILTPSYKWIIQNATSFIEENKERLKDLYDPNDNNSIDIFTKKINIFDNSIFNIKKNIKEIFKDQSKIAKIINKIFTLLFKFFYYKNILLNGVIKNVHIRIEDDQLINYNKDICFGLKIGNIDIKLGSEGELKKYQFKVDSLDFYWESNPKILISSSLLLGFLNKNNDLDEKYYAKLNEIKLDGTDIKNQKGKSGVKFLIDNFNCKMSLNVKSLNKGEIDLFGNKEKNYQINFHFASSDLNISVFPDLLLILQSFQKFIRQFSTLEQVQDFKPMRKPYDLTNPNVKELLLYIDKNQKNKNNRDVQFLSKFLFKKKMLVRDWLYYFFWCKKCGSSINKRKLNVLQIEYSRFFNLVFEQFDFDNCYNNESSIDENNVNSNQKEKDKEQKEQSNNNKNTDLKENINLIFCGDLAIKSAKIYINNSISSIDLNKGKLININVYGIEAKIYLNKEKFDLKINVNNIDGGVDEKNIIKGNKIIIENRKEQIMKMMLCNMPSQIQLVNMPMNQEEINNQNTQNNLQNNMQNVANNNSKIQLHKHNKNKDTSGFMQKLLNSSSNKNNQNNQNMTFISNNQQNISQNDKDNISIYSKLTNSNNANNSIEIRNNCHYNDNTLNCEYNSKQNGHKSVRTELPNAANIFYDPYSITSNYQSQLQKESQKMNNNNINQKNKFLNSILGSNDANKIYQKEMDKRIQKDNDVSNKIREFNQRKFMENHKGNYNNINMNQNCSLQRQISGNKEQIKLNNANSHRMRKESPLAKYKNNIPLPLPKPNEHYSSNMNMNFPIMNLNPINIVNANIPKIDVSNVNTKIITSEDKINLPLLIINPISCKLQNNQEKNKSIMLNYVKFNDILKPDEINISLGQCRVNLFAQYISECLEVFTEYKNKMNKPEIKNNAELMSSLSKKLIVRKKLMHMQKYFYNYLANLKSEKNETIKNYMNYLQKEIQKNEKINSMKGSYEINYILTLINKGVNLKIDYDSLDCIYYNKENNGSTNVLGRCLLPQIDLNILLNMSKIIIRFFGFELEINDLDKTKNLIDILKDIIKDKLKIAKIVIDPCLKELKQVKNTKFISPNPIKNKAFPVMIQKKSLDDQNKDKSVDLTNMNFILNKNNFDKGTNQPNIFKEKIARNSSYDSEDGNDDECIQNFSDEEQDKISQNAENITNNINEYNTEVKKFKVPNYIKEICSKNYKDDDQFKIFNYEDKKKKNREDNK